MTEPHTITSTRVTIDYSVPLWGVLSVVGAGLLALVGMYFNGLQTQKAVEELQILMKSGNQSVTVLNSEVNLLKFRVETIDSSVKALQEQARK
ncbi:MULTISPECIES: hypothetical protein [unclassified Polaromonas]|jgi:hypothetical protein|uniref:hypothetical protein n=1 Tax=unclassified Polaromonas TaxID=2638319 RepID=UPI000BD59A37|nr:MULTISPECIES: hypothetical protein [unclassified Polaromonas]OYZ79702.1 MAG: hypothetical protein B7Y09_09270 [Polaromonas sp. 24-63-21]OZA47282.1 MAG: hypothetical protein B7X88_22540 [Polaromonas sp. 17-63-33]HQS00786.1 hypothetical protein [Polaromonas sp.]HQS38967.1 hypothetical protein [Polaromonas sp.]HQT09531.1 hypothetical protein [Polaromonas sp.]